MREVARSQLLDQLNQLHDMKGAAGLAIRAIDRIKPLPDAEATMRHYDEAIAEVVAGEEVTPDPSLPKGVQKLLRSLTTPANQPFSRELLGYDLTETIGEVHEPILVVIGKKDIQVDWKLDGGALERATAGVGDVSFAYPEGANHVMKHERETEGEAEREVRRVPLRFRRRGARRGGRVHNLQLVADCCWRLTPNHEGRVTRAR